MHIAEEDEDAAEGDNDLGGGRVTDVDPDDVSGEEEEAVTVTLTSRDTHIHHLFTKNLLNTLCSRLRNEKYTLLNLCLLTVF